MTMQNSNHPPDELLATLAGGDPEATGDRGLREHVDTCIRCAGLVSEIRVLRATLAELPDLTPPRPLQLLPPAPAARERRGWLAALRGIAVPVMAAGAGLAIVGAVGLGSMVAGGATGGGPALFDDSAGRMAAEGASMAPDEREPEASPAAAPPAVASAAPESDQSVEPAFGRLTDTSTPMPWLVLLGGGGVLLAAGLVLRFAINPRAG